MSIVEKAAEKLKALQPEPQVLPPVEPVSPHIGTPPPHHHVGTVERLQERAREFDQDADTLSPRPAATIERLDERAQRVDQAVETAPLWHIDTLALEHRGLLPADNEAGARLADELRRVKRPLLDNAAGKGARIFAHAERIVVTSAAPGEGKTFTAVNLALSLARERDFEVLLVDGDVAKSDITRAFGLDGRPGLMEVLADERCQPAEVIVRTDVPNLLVVPAGGRQALAAELFGSLRMEYVLQVFGGRNRRRLVLFDSSPLLATSESQVLASHMGQVVVVVAAGRTRQQAVDSALESLNDSQCVGLILNMSRLSATENYYDHYYGRYARDQEGEA